MRQRRSNRVHWNKEFAALPTAGARGGRSEDSRPYCPGTDMKGGTKTLPRSITRRRFTLLFSARSRLGSTAPHYGALRSRGLLCCSGAHWSSGHPRVEHPHQPLRGDDAVALNNEVFHFSPVGVRAKSHVNAAVLSHILRNREARVGFHELRLERECRSDAEAHDVVLIASPTHEDLARDFAMDAAPRPILLRFGKILNNREETVVRGVFDHVSNLRAYRTGGAGFNVMTRT